MSDQPSLTDEMSAPCPHGVDLNYFVCPECGNTPTQTLPVQHRPDPRNDPEDAYQAFMGMGDTEWLNLCWSLLQGGVLTPNEQIGFDRALSDRGCRQRPRTYKIVRFYADDTPSQVIDTGLSLEAAQAHCNHPTTRGDGWFDGYEVEQ